MSRLIIVLAIFLSISVSMMGTAAAPPPCNLVLGQLNPCVLPYLMRQENNPESGCCNGVKYLQTYSADKGDRQAICECLESAAPAFAGLDYSLVSSLPQQCGVPVKLPKIGSANFDCSKA